MRLGWLICFAGLIGLGIAGRAAASNLTFAATGAFSDGAALGGTFVINTATGVVQSSGIDLTVTGGTDSVDLLFDELHFSGDFTATSSNHFWEMDFGESSDSDPILQLVIPLGSLTTLVGFTGGPGSLCTFPGNCLNGAWFSNYEPFASDPPLASGQLTVSAAPEPASAWLLAIPAVWIVRRRRSRA